MPSNFKPAPHPGFSIPVSARRQIQSALRVMRSATRPAAAPMNRKVSKAVMELGLASIELVLQLHLKPEQGPGLVRLVRLQPKTIGALAQARYALLTALARGTCDNEPEMDWFQSRAYRHTERAVEVVGAVMRKHRAARAGAKPAEVALA